MLDMSSTYENICQKKSLKRMGQNYRIKSMQLYNITTMISMHKEEKRMDELCAFDLCN
jgi:hypothetical protein